MPRTRLPLRRHAITFNLTVSNAIVIATVGLDPNSFKPRELFLTGVKTGADMAAILDDVSVVISVALQHGITAHEMAHSISPGHASVLGAALELIVGFEEEGPEYCPRVPGLRVISS